MTEKHLPSAFADSGCLVKARTRKLPSWSKNRATEPPWAPVAPHTATSGLAEVISMIEEAQKDGEWGMVCGLEIKKFHSVEYMSDIPDAQD